LDLALFSWVKFVGLEIALFDCLKNIIKIEETYIFLIYEFKNLHEIVNHLIQLEDPTHYLLQVDQAGPVSKLGQLLYFELQFLIKVHHIHSIHQFFECLDSFFPMFVDDGNSFIFIELFIFVIGHHFGQRGG
jgi:hypothetical protein